MTEALKYCRIYNLPIDLAGLMQYIDKKFWWLFSSKKVIYMMERNITLTCGYYEGYGAQAKKVDLSKKITEACDKAGYTYKEFNDAPKKGVKGQKVKIYF